MKDMDAMTLAVVRDRMRSGRKPPRDIVLAFLADEEAGGTYGAKHLVRKHPELFEGVTEAIGEVGGFSFTVNEKLRASTSSRPPRRACTGCGSPSTAPPATAR
ncbi:hypothetical protein SALBM217S_05681 [Streptomyces griseoloalbus]